MASATVAGLPTNDERAVTSMTTSRRLSPLRAASSRQRAATFSESPSWRTRPRTIELLPSTSGSMSGSGPSGS